MNIDNFEQYLPRPVTDLGNWDIHGLKYKVYGITAKGKEISETLLDDARRFIATEVSVLIRAQGEDNGLGFVVIHPGDLGVSILVHWWIQGSVLCQHITRKLWDADVPLDSASRPVIACVWELGLINAEQKIWRETMMTGEPDPAAYISTRSTIKDV